MRLTRSIWFWKAPMSTASQTKGLFENWRCVQQRGILGLWQAIFSQESWRISRKNCAVQGTKAPPVGHVDMFQTSPKTHAIISRISAPTTLLVRPSKKSSAQVQRRRQSQENCNHVVSPQFPPVSDIFSSILRNCRPVDLLLPFINAVAVNPQSQCLRRGTALVIFSIKSATSERMRGVLLGEKQTGIPNHP